MKTVSLSDRFDLALRQSEINEDFQFGTPAGWTAAGTAAGTDARGGVLSLTTAATDNTAASITPNNKTIVVVEDKPVIARFYFQFAEAAVNVANVFVGLFSGAIATAVGNDGAGPPSSYSGFAFFKVDGNLNWFVEASNGSTQVTIELNAFGSLDERAKVAGSSAFQLIEIQVLPKTATKADVSFELNNVCVAKLTDFDITSLAAMAPVILTRAGSAVAQPILVDLIQAAQVR